MRDVTKHPWQWRRTDGTSNWYLRAKVPKDLVPVLGKREIKRSLGTSNRKEASELIDAEAAKVREIFAEARRGYKPRPLESLSDREVRQIAIDWFQRYERNAAQRRYSEPFDDDYDLEDVVEALEQEADVFSDPRNPNAIASVRPDAEKALGEAGISTNSNAPQYWMLCEFLKRAMKEHFLRSAAWYKGDYSATFDPIFSETTGEASARKAPVENGITLGELIERFLTDRGHLQEKTKTDYGLLFRLTEEAWGREKLVRTINREDARKVRDVLASLPPNATKRFKHMSLSDAARHAKRNGITPLNPVTANGYLDKQAAFFRWAVQEEHIDRNPAANLRVAAPEASKRDARHPFSTEQLSKMFYAPHYVGCQDDGRGYAKAGPNCPRRHRFWVPLLSLFLGLRLNEACQLRVEDVTCEQGVDVILVTPMGDGKKLKSDAAMRTIPLHPELIKIGFLDYVTAMREQKRERLFPDLKMDGRGYRSDAFQKWFGRFLKGVGAKTSKTSFHSFRHSWRDELRAANVPLERAQAMGGWADGSRTDDRYGSGFRAPDLAEETAKVKYEGLDLSHLYIKR